MNYRIKRRKRFISSSVSISVIAIFITIFIVSVSYQLINWANKQSEVTKERSKASLNLLKRFDSEKDTTFKLTSKDIKEINLHIDALSVKANDEVQHNIDWINTFMAIGIGLLAVFGGLLPLAVNFFSKQDLQEKIENLEDDIQSNSKDVIKLSNKSVEAELKANAAISSMNGYEVRLTNLQSSIQELERKVSPFEERIVGIEQTIDKVPYINALILHNAISRLLSADSIRYYTESNRYERLLTILSGIRTSFEEYSIVNFDNHTTENYEFIIAIITDLKIGFFYSPINHSMPKRVLEKINEFCLFLDQFKNGNEASFPELFKKASNQLQELLELIQKQIKTSTA